MERNIFHRYLKNPDQKIHSKRKESLKKKNIYVNQIDAKYTFLKRYLSIYLFEATNPINIYLIYSS